MSNPFASGPFCDLCHEKGSAVEMEFLSAGAFAVHDPSTADGHGERKVPSGWECPKCHHFIDNEPDEVEPDASPETPVV